MQDQKQQFYISFCMTKLNLLEDILDQLELFTYFKIEVYKSNRLVGATQEVLCAPNEHMEIFFQGDFMKFRFVLNDESVKESCEIKLIQVSEEGPEKVIGCYQFLLNNYVKAYCELNRNCIELNVQIAHHYQIIYDVFIEKTEQAIDRIIKEHQMAKKLNIQQDIQEIDYFLPFEIYNQNCEQNYRQIKIDQASPLLFSERLWSPKRIRFPVSKTPSIGSKTAEKSLQTTANSFNIEKVSFLKLSKSLSSSGQLKCNNSSWQNNQRAQNILQELDVESQTQDNNQKFIKLYEVIRSDSKIILPEQLNRSTQPVEPEKQSEDKTLKRSLKRYNNPLKYIILTVLIVTILCFFVFLFDSPSLELKTTRRTRRAKQRE